MQISPFHSIYSSLLEPAGGKAKQGGAKGKQSFEQQLMGEAGSDIDEDELEVGFNPNFKRYFGNF